MTTNANDWLAGRKPEDGDFPHHVKTHAREGAILADRTSMAYKHVFPRDVRLLIRDWLASGLGVHARGDYRLEAQPEALKFIRKNNYLLVLTEHTMTGTQGFAPRARIIIPSPTDRTSIQVINNVCAFFGVRCFLYVTGGTLWALWFNDGELSYAPNHVGDKLVATGIIDRSKL